MSGEKQPEQKVEEDTNPWPWCGSCSRENGPICAWARWWRLFPMFFLKTLAREAAQQLASRLRTKFEVRTFAIGVFATWNDRGYPPVCTSWQACWDRTPAAVCDRAAPSSTWKKSLKKRWWTISSRSICRRGRQFHVRCVIKSLNLKNWFIRLSRLEFSV